MVRSRIAFGSHVFDPKTNALRRGRERCALPSQPALLLGLLLEHPGEVVTRDEIRSALWPEISVAYDQCINFAIRQIRVALGPDADLPDAQSPARTTSVIVRTHLDPMSLARPIRAAVVQLDDRQPLTEVESLSTTIADSLSPVRIIERLLIVGAGIAVALAALGIYGVLAHWVSARQRELGVRFALGATRVAIFRLVVREALLTACGGIVIGLGLAIAIVRLAGRALLGVPALDFRAAIIVAACAVAMTIGGSLGPARRAARIDVAELLRLE